jgi:hypothetical protein
LVNDLGIKTTRKGNIFAELFLPTAPRHYRGLIDEFRRAQSKKQVLAMQAAKATAAAARTAVLAKPNGTAVRHEMNGHANGKLNGGIDDDANGLRSAVKENGVIIRLDQQSREWAAEAK